MKPAQIVLIEDNPADVLLVELALKENDIICHLTRFANGEEAVRVLCGPEAPDSLVPDAILLDLTRRGATVFKCSSSSSSRPV